MKKRKLISLVKIYQEWENELDGTNCPTGWVFCRVCDGRGYIDSRKTGYSLRKPSEIPPKHKNNCLREKFEKDHRNSFNITDVERCLWKIEERLGISTEDFTKNAKLINNETFVGDIKIEHDDAWHWRELISIKNVIENIL